MENSQTEIIEPMALPKLFKKLMACAKTLDEMDLNFSDHPKLRNLMKDHFPNFSATTEQDMPDGRTWKKIFFRGIVVISNKCHGQLPEHVLQSKSLLLTFWNDHSVTATPIDLGSKFFEFTEWKEETYADFFRTFEIYLKNQKCFKKKKIV